MSDNFGSYKVIKGDATNPKAEMSGTPIVIPHVCNNIGAWGAGFVMALNKQFGEAPMQAYKAWHERGQGKAFSYQTNFPPNEIKYCHEKGVRFGLGKTQYVHVGNRVVVANMVAQAGTAGRAEFTLNDGPTFPPIRYGALLDCMRSILGEYKKARGYAVTPFEIHCPKFGSDLAGGSWDEIEKMINEVWVQNGITVVAYEYDPNA